MAGSTMLKLIATAFVCVIVVAPQAKAHYAPDPLSFVLEMAVLSPCYGFMETGKTDSLFFNELFCCVGFRLVNSFAYSSQTSLRDTCYIIENFVKLFKFNLEYGKELCRKCNINSTYAFEPSINCSTLRLP
ncbi:Non-specific lipid-transfer protein-like protein [Drosera capensis]